MYGWILAAELYTGLAGAGPNFSQAAVVNALNRQTAFSANGLIPPIDWTKAHIDPEKHPEALSDLDCNNAVIVQNGKLVPYVSTPDKPWTCFNRNDPTRRQPAARELRAMRTTAVAFATAVTSYCWSCTATLTKKLWPMPAVDTRPCESQMPKWLSVMKLCRIDVPVMCTDGSPEKIRMPVVWVTPASSSPLTLFVRMKLPSITLLLRFDPGK